LYRGGVNGLASASIHNFSVKPAHIHILSGAAWATNTRGLGKGRRNYKKQQYG
jgi:hypothetical protein